MIKLSINLIEEIDTKGQYGEKKVETNVFIDTEHIEGSRKAIAALLRGLADDLAAPAVKANYTINGPGMY